MMTTTAASPTTPTAAPASRRLVLALLCLTMATAVFNDMIITPVLPDIAARFQISVSTAGLLASGYALAGGILALFSGALLARFGRRNVILLGMGLLAVATLGSLLAPTFAVLFFFRVLAGFGVACLVPVVFSTLGEEFAYAERGQAMGWVTVASTAASVLFMPIGALVTALFSWRATFGLLCVVVGVATAILALRFPRPGVPANRTSIFARALGDYRRIGRDRGLIAALVAHWLQVSFWFIWATYIGAYYQDVYGLETAWLAPVLATLGIGGAIGGYLCGRLADRYGKRSVVMIAGYLAALSVTLETTAVPWVWLAVLLNVAVAGLGTGRYTASATVISELVPEARATSMALSVTMQQCGIMTGALLGSAVVALVGYHGLGPAAAVLMLLANAVFGRFVRERTS
ncbi:MAG: MFS transporter [Chloroflexi bacterium]|nr:MFS transporter [Chloroflexota bacterium]